MPGIENNLHTFNDKDTTIPELSASNDELLLPSDRTKTTADHPNLAAKMGDNSLPLLTITSNSARGRRDGLRADSFYQDLVEGKALLGVQLVRQKTKEFFDDIPATPGDNGSTHKLEEERPPSCKLPHQLAENHNSAMREGGSLSEDAKQLVTGDIDKGLTDTGAILSSDSTTISGGNGDSNNISENKSLNPVHSSNMDTSPPTVVKNTVENSHRRMYLSTSESSSSCSDVNNDDDGYGDVVKSEGRQEKDNNNRETTNENDNCDVTTGVVTSPTIGEGNKGVVNSLTTEGEEIVNYDDKNTVNDQNSSEAELHIKSDNTTMDGNYSQDVDYSKFPNTGFLQTLEQQSSDFDGEEEEEGEEEEGARGYGGYSQDFSSQPSSLCGGGDGLPQLPRPDLILPPLGGVVRREDEGQDQGLEPSNRVSDVRGSTSPGVVVENEDCSELGGRSVEIDDAGGSDRKGPEKEDALSQKSSDTYTKGSVHHRRQEEADPSEGGDTYNYEDDDFTDSETELGITANKSQTTAEYLTNYSESSLIYSRGISGSEKKSYTSVASSKTLHGRPQKRYSSEKKHQPLPPSSQRRELKPTRGGGESRPSPVNTSNFSRQSSSTRSQRITFRQKAGIKLVRGGYSGVGDHHHRHEATSRNRKKPSVPTQIKAEALWCDGLLQVTLRGPPSKLPPIDASLLSHNPTTPTFPIDLELTFIPEYHNNKPAGAAYRYNKSTARFPTKSMTNTATATATTVAPIQQSTFQYLKKRKPVVVGSSFATVPETDRNVIDNRAVGIGFNMQLTPPKDRMPVTKLPHISHKQQQYQQQQQPQHSHRSQAPHNVASSAPSKPSKHSYRRA